MNKTFIAILFLFFSFICKAQSNHAISLDSLNNVLAKQNDLFVIAATQKQIADYYSDSGEHFKSLESLRQSIETLQKIKPNSDKITKQIAFNKVNIGREYYFIGNESKAMENYLDAYKVLPENIDLLLNISVLFNYSKNYQKAIYYTNLAEKVINKNKQFKYLNKIWTRKSLMALDKNDTINAIKFTDKAIFYSKKYRDIMQEAILYSSKGDLMKDPNDQIALYLQARKIWDSYGKNNLLSISNYISIGEFYKSLYSNEKLLHKFKGTITKNQAVQLAEDNFATALKYCKEIKHFGANYQFSLENLSYIYEFKKDYKKSLEYFQNCVFVYDSLNSQKQKNNLANLEANFKIDVKDKELIANNKILASEKKVKYYFIFALLLLSIIGLLLFFQSRNRKKTNEKLQLLNSELDTANKTKTRFFSILNHDLRAPVSNLIHFLHLQKDSPELLDEETKKRMETKTISGAENLLSSMEDILLWSKGQMENFKPQPKKSTVNQLFLDTQKVFSGYHKINFKYYDPDNIEIVTDENYLKTIVRNLTSNAINVFTNTPNPEIIWKAWQENGKSYLSISDNGPGASTEQFKALYDDKEVVGIKTGLGLHLIRDLAKAINCDIKVESKMDHGTTFILVF